MLGFTRGGGGGETCDIDASRCDGNSSLCMICHCDRCIPLLEKGEY